MIERADGRAVELSAHAVTRYRERVRAGASWEDVERLVETLPFATRWNDRGPRPEGYLVGDGFAFMLQRRRNRPRDHRDDLPARARGVTTSIRELVAPEPEPFTGTPWWEMRMVGFDLETTHADPEEARIVVAAVVEVGAGQPTRSRSWLVDPGIEIPADAMAVHGITTEQAREAGHFAGDAIPEILDAIAERPEGSALVIFNARFDLTVADREARRYGVRPLVERGPLLTVDPFILDKHLEKYRPGKRTLTATAQHYGLRLDEDGHDADYDALLACRLAWQIATKAHVERRHAHERNPLEATWQRIRPDLAALHEAQIQWARFEAVGLRQHFRRIGNPRADEVRPEWPLIPREAT